LLGNGYYNRYLGDELLLFGVGYLRDRYWKRNC
jgi:hypothetical protein